MSISLKKADQERLARSRKTAVVNRRKEVAAGYPLAAQFGAPLALAYGFMAYHLIAQRGYTLFPPAVARLPQYGIIFASTFIGFAMGRAAVQSVFDDKSGNIDNSRAREYLNGTGALDPLQEE
mmetsp:Transcript_20861/g.18479  ORF Transcript_20861/g.18479 Transcript_20861/m.18479 type:complete len:123 (+) Transcript_20861:36-404(+)